MRPPEICKPYSLLAPAEWPRAWSALATSTFTGRTWDAWAALTPLIAAAGLAATRRRPGWSGSIILFSAGWLYLASVAAVDWVSARSGDPRYALPALALLSASAGASLSSVAGRAGTALRWAACLAGLAAALFHAGLPRPGGIVPRLDRSIGTATPDLIRLGVTHVAGDYTRVWPAVFHANMALYNSGKPRVVWALTSRNAPTRALWDYGNRRDWRIAVLHGDTGLTAWSPQLKGARETARTPLITVFHPAVK
jgi:hypothetical protein